MNKRYTKEEVAAMFANSGNALARISLNYNTTKLLDPECIQYIDHYEKELTPFRNRKVKLLEIGVKDGESLKMWKEYLHSDSEVYGIELNPNPLSSFNEKGIKIMYGDQTDIHFLKTVQEYGPFDIIIDDGGHTMFQMRTSFEYLFRYALSDNGIYVIEDLGTSYWYKWSGGIDRQGTMMSKLKELADGINHRFWKGNRLDYVPIPPDNLVDADYFDEHITEIKFCKGISFVQKGNNKFIS